MPDLRLATLMLALTPALTSALTPAWAAAADCPTPEDMKTGVYLHFDDGDYSRYVQVGESYVQEDEFIAGEGLDYRIISHLGVYPVDEHDVMALGLPDPDTRLTTKFGVPEAELPKPVEGLDWHGENRLVYNDGVEEKELMHVVVGPQKTIRLGDCTYEALPLSISYEWPETEETMVQLSHYLPAFGISLLLSTKYNDEPTDSYTHTALSTSAP